MANSLGKSEVSGSTPDVVAKSGRSDPTRQYSAWADGIGDTIPWIGPDTLFYPAALAFDGTYLWVAEFKFSERLLRFSGSG